MLRSHRWLVIPLLIAAAPASRAAPAPAPAPVSPGSSAPAARTSPAQTVELRPRPGTAPDAAARELAAQDLAEAKRAGQTPLVLTGSAVLGGSGSAPALFVQLQSPRECGSAGCETSAYVHDPGGWRKVLDSVSGPVTVDRAQHLGMHDLLVGRTRFVWNGSTYADARPGPALHIRRR